MKKSIILSFIWVIFLVACSQRSNNKGRTSACDCSIDSITALYFNHYFNRVSAIKCESLTEADIPDFVHDDTGLLDAVITDCNVLKEVEKELSKLKSETDYYQGDTRLKFNVYYNNEYVKYICLSGIYGTRMYNDDILQQHSNRLIYLLKNNIGYYSWFDEEDYKYMDELNDTTFAKEPIIESPYYKKYKEMQKKK